MKRIASFEIDHTRLIPGLYVSRKDPVGQEMTTTFDIRMKQPNKEPVINTAELHTIEHLGATFLRNHPNYKDDVLYFGPMGCRTGFYLVMHGDLDSQDVLELVKEMFYFIQNFQGDIPGASPRECGNYLDQNLTNAQYEAKKYLDILENATEKNLNYPQL